MKYKHIQLISLLIDYLTSHQTIRRLHGLSADDLSTYLIDHGIRYPEKAMRELTLEVQERLATYE